MQTRKFELKPPLLSGCKKTVVLPARALIYWALGFPTAAAYVLFSVVTALFDMGTESKLMACGSSPPPRICLFGPVLPLANILAIDETDGTMLSESWDRISQDPRRRANFFGDLSLTNRPLRCSNSKTTGSQQGLHELLHTLLRRRMYSTCSSATIIACAVSLILSVMNMTVEHR